MAAIFIMAQTFFVVSVFSFVIYGSAKTISYLESVPQVHAFFKNETKQDDINSLEKELQSTGKIAKITYVSKEQALKIYQQQNKNEPLLLEMVSAQILPASLAISTVRIEDLTSISNVLKKSSVVDKVVYQEDIINTLTSWTNALRKLGFGLIVVLVFDSIFIMGIIVGIRISQKREEIEIMRLLGATSWYVRWPFIFEGVIYGISGAIIGFFLSTGALWYVMPLLAAQFRDIPISPLSPTFLLQLFGAEILLSILLGMFASSLAVLRYLK